MHRLYSYNENFDFLSRVSLPHPPSRYRSSSSDWCSCYILSCVYFRYNCTAPYVPCGRNKVIVDIWRRGYFKMQDSRLAVSLTSHVLQYTLHTSTRSVSCKTVQYCKFCKCYCSYYTLRFSHCEQHESVAYNNHKCRSSMSSLLKRRPLWASLLYATLRVQMIWT